MSCFFDAVSDPLTLKITKLLNEEIDFETMKNQPSRIDEIFLYPRVYSTSGLYPFSLPSNLSFLNEHWSQMIREPLLKLERAGNERRARMRQLLRSMSGLSFTTRTFGAFFEAFSTHHIRDCCPHNRPLQCMIWLSAFPLWLILIYIFALLYVGALLLDILTFRWFCCSNSSKKKAFVSEIAANYPDLDTKGNDGIMKEGLLALGRDLRQQFPQLKIFQKTSSYSISTQHGKKHFTSFELILSLRNTDKDENDEEPSSERKSLLSV